MGNHCGSLRKKTKSRSDVNAEEREDDIRKNSSNSADNPTSGQNAQESRPAEATQLPVAGTSGGSASTSSGQQGDSKHHLSVAKKEGGDSSSSSPLKDNQQSLPVFHVNPPTSPAPSSCSPAPPPLHCNEAMYTIPEYPDHVIAISAGLNKIRVFKITKEQVEPVRAINNVTQPRHLQLLDPYNALVLCNRELMVINLDQGIMVRKLKGVMNQKMPFYGLHSNQYAVALSRNRMYVNLFSLATGNLETTFKVGEDRFLNSLLVSKNGRICVCGDETQKPFPLLVWDLTLKKLIYDLRVPHHEFITKLAAITNDGHYVACVSREISSMSSNFIVVYDLQSGTLFKKWKPSCNTVSIAISSNDLCVINGIENNHILVWDLSTGAIRYTLEGHTHSVDKLFVADSGRFVVSYDSTGLDSGILVWDITSGLCVKTYTPQYAVSCCLLTSTASHLLLSSKDSDSINVIKLDVPEQPSSKVYGKPDLLGSELDLTIEKQ